jgi:predicted MFS family arabinose efflux permease
LLLLAVTFAAGIVGAAANPSTNKLISHHLPEGRRGFAIGLKQSGGPLGIFLAGAALPGLADWLGWRQAIAVSALLPIVGFLLSMWSVPHDRPDRSRSVPSPKQRISPEVIKLTINGALVAGGTSAMLGFLPLFAQEEVGFSAAGAGAVAGVVGIVGIAGRLLWGWAAERMVGVSTALLIISLGAAVASVAIWLSPEFGPGLLWVGAVLAGASLLAWNAVGMLALLTLTPAEETGTASGIVLFGFLAGWAATPWIFGVAVDTFGSYNVGWGLVVACFLASAAVLPASPRRRKLSDVDQ